MCPYFFLSQFFSFSVKTRYWVMSPFGLLDIVAWWLHSVVSKSPVVIFPDRWFSQLTLKLHLSKRRGDWKYCNLNMYVYFYITFIFVSYTHRVDHMPRSICGTRGLLIRVGFLFLPYTHIWILRPARSRLFIHSFIHSFIHVHVMLEQNQSCLLARQAFFHMSHTHSPLLNSLGMWGYLIVFIFILIMNNVQHLFWSMDACVCTGVCEDQKTTTSVTLQ